MEILGKKVYVVPAHISLLQDFMDLDNIMPDEAKAVAEIVEVFYSFIYNYFSQLKPKTVFFLFNRKRR